MHVHMADSELQSLMNDVDENRSGQSLSQSLSHSPLTVSHTQLSHSLVGSLKTSQIMKLHS